MPRLADMERALLANGRRLPDYPRRDWYVSGADNQQIYENRVYVAYKRLLDEQKAQACTRRFVPFVILVVLLIAGVGIEGLWPKSSVTSAASNTATTSAARAPDSSKTPSSPPATSPPPPPATKASDRDSSDSAFDPTSTAKALAEVRKYSTFGEGPPPCIEDDECNSHVKQCQVKGTLTKDVYYFWQHDKASGCQHLKLNVPAEWIQWATSTTKTAVGAAVAMSAATRSDSAAALAVKLGVTAAAWAADSVLSSKLDEKKLLDSVVHNMIADREFNAKSGQGHSEL